MIGRFTLAAIVLHVAACGADPKPQAVALQFTADPGPPGSERYLCFGFDAAVLDGADLGALALEAPAGPVTLHHVALYSTPDDVPAGPTECETMPQGAVSLHVWAVGTGDLVLPPDLALAIPDGTTHLIVQAHVLRIDEGPPAAGTVLLTPRRGAVHRAGWLPLRVPTPAIYPHQRVTSQASCQVAAELHVISTWPHMHLIGTEFHGAVVHAGSSSALIDIVPYEYDTQRAYPIDAVVSPGDQISSACTWDNPGDTTVLPGPLISDEMCEQSLIAWPVEAAHCE